jgi:hypothetical protein
MAGVSAATQRQFYLGVLSIPGEVREKHEANAAPLDNVAQHTSKNGDGAYRLL